MKKRVVVISDLHCGHLVGLTPPEFWHNDTDKNYKTFAMFERGMWKFYADTMMSLQPIDILICDGDAVEGKGEKSGGTELLEPDPTRQAQIAVKCIQEAKAKKTLLIYGTPYHTGACADYENIVADKLGCQIKGHEWIDVEGVIFDFKHFVSSSIVPYGRNTSLNRDRMWNQLWAIDDSQPEADIVIRSHDHYFTGSFGADYLAMITPALQGYGSKFGVRRCSGRVDIGFIHFDIDRKEDFRKSWYPHIMKTEFMKSKPIKL